MELTLQKMLMVAGLLAFVAGVTTAIVAARTYVRLDIRGVRDDLSGKTRQRIMAEHRAHASAIASKRPAPPAQPTTNVGDKEDGVATVVGMASVPVEPVGEDVLPTQVHGQAQATCTFEVTRDVCQVHSDSVIGTREVGRAW